MTQTDTDLMREHLANTRRAITLAPALGRRLEAIAADARDGYPTSVPLASQTATPGPVYEGICIEQTEQTTTVRSLGKPDRTLTLRVPCRKQRPCPEHDAAMTYTSTERAALNPTRDNTRRLITLNIAKITKALDELAYLADNQHAPLHPPQLCNGGLGRTAYDGRTCTNIPDPRCAGMCDHCASDYGLERQPDAVCRKCGTKPQRPGSTTGVCNACQQLATRKKNAA